MKNLESGNDDIEEPLQSKSLESGNDEAGNSVNNDLDDIINVGADKQESVESPECNFADIPDSDIFIGKRKGNST